MNRVEKSVQRVVELLLMLWSLSTTRLRWKLNCRLRLGRVASVCIFSFIFKVSMLFCQDIPSPCNSNTCYALDEDLMVSLNCESIYDSPTCDYSIPLNFVYCKELTSVEKSRLYLLVQNTNEYFKNNTHSIPIEFYVNEIIEDGTNPCNHKKNLFLNSNNESQFNNNGIIEINIVDQFLDCDYEIFCENLPTSTRGKANFPWSGSKVFIIKDELLLINGFLLAHELGHYFGLYHTFHNHLASGGACSGDLVEDTSEDPSSLGSTQTDNIMDYNDLILNSTLFPSQFNFTFCQKAKMLDVLFFCRSETLCKPKKPKIYFNNQINQTIELVSEDQISYIQQCGLPLIQSDCEFTIWYVTDSNGQEIQQNIGSIFQPLTDLSPIGTGNFTYIIKAYRSNFDESSTDCISDAFTFKIRVINGNQCYDCGYVFDIIPTNILTNNGSGSKTVMDCESLPPCAECGSGDISNYCVLPLTKDTIINLCDPLPEFIALDDCYQWFESTLSGGIFGADINSMRDGRTFTPTNITQPGTYYYRLVDVRKSLIEDCHIQLQITAEGCPPELPTITINDCLQAGDTESISWTGIDGATIRLAMSLDGGDKWVFPSDINLSDSGFGLSTANDGAFSWDIPCISDLMGLEIVETSSAVVGIFPHNSNYGFDEDGNNIIIQSDPFSIKKCDSCLDIIVDSLYVNPSGQINGGDDVFINAIIANVGIVDLPSSPDCQVEFYFSDDQIADSSEYIENERIGQLTIGDDDIEYTDFIIPLDIPDGQYYFIAKLNCETSLGSPCEESEFILPVFKGNAEVDIKIITASVSPVGNFAPGCPIRLNYTTLNSGTLDIDDTSMGIYLSTDAVFDASDQSIHTDQVPQIIANGSYPDIVDITLPSSIVDGNYYLIMNADQDDDEQESNEFDNIYTLPIVIASLPDLSISDVVLSTTRIVGNSTIDYSFDVTNLGPIASAGTNYSICLSTDNIADANDLVLSTGSIAALMPSLIESITGQANVPTLSNNGQQNIIIKIDEAESLIEKSEENNVAILTVSVAPFDLACVITPAECGGNNGSVDIIPQGGTAPFMYSWATGDNTNLIANLTADFYSVTVTDANGNTARKSPYVSDNGDPKWEFVRSCSLPISNNSNILRQTPGNGKYYIFDKLLSKLTIFDSNCMLLKESTFDNIAVSQMFVGRGGHIYFVGDLMATTNGVIPPSIPTAIAAIGYTYSGTSWPADLIKLDQDCNVQCARAIGFTYSCSGPPCNQIAYPYIPTEAIVFSNGSIALKDQIRNSTVSTNILNDSSSSTVLSLSPVYIGSEISFLIKYDVDCSYQSKFVLSGINDINNSQQIIQSLSVSPDDFLYFQAYQIGSGFGIGSSSPFGNGNRLLKLNSSLQNVWQKDINSYQVGISNIGFTFDNSPLISISGLGAIPGVFNSSFTANTTFLLNPINGFIIWNKPTVYNLTSGNSNGTVIGIRHGNDSLIEIIDHDTGATIQEVENPYASTSWLSVNPSANGYQLNSSTSIDIIEYNIFNTSISIDLPDVLYRCGDEIVVLDAKNEGLDYLWSTGETTQSIEVSTQNKYYVTVTNMEGCAVIDSVQVTVLDELQISSETTPDYCLKGNGSISLELSGGLTPYSYLWLDGSLDAERVNLSSGQYIVTITDANQCTIETSIEVQADQGLIDAVFDINHSSCGRTNGSLELSSFIGGASPFVAVWSDSEIGVNRRNLAPGNYNVTLTDVNGCSIVKMFTINESSAIETLASIETPTNCNTQDAVISLQSSQGVEPYSYAWDDLFLGEIRNNMESGTYFVTVTDNIGCSTIERIEIASFQESVLDYVTTPAICNGGSIALGDQYDLSAVDIKWSTGDIGLSINNLTPGIYTVTITDQFDCMQEDRIEIIGNQFLEVAITDNSVLCEDLSELTAKVIGGVSPYSYLWSDGSQSATAYLDEGIHSVTVSDDIGCTIVNQYEIRNESNAGLITFEPDKTICAGESAAIQLIIEGAISPFDITLSDGQNIILIEDYALGQFIDVSPTSSTTYTIVEVIDGLGCSATSTDKITISVLPKILLVANLLDIQICQGTSGKVEPIILGGTAPYTLRYNDGTTTFTQDNFVNGDQVELVSTPNNVYYFTNVEDVNGCEFSFIDRVNIIETPCTISNNFLPTDPCACNDDQSANGAEDGTFSETISVSTTSAGQTWTVVSLASLQPNGALPQGISVGSQLTFDAVNNRHFTDFMHTDLSGYAISVEGPNEEGNLNNVVLDFQNICRYPTILTDVVEEEYTLCRDELFSLLDMNRELNNATGVFEILIDGQVSTMIDPQDLGAGVHTVSFLFNGDFINNSGGTLATPAFPGCSTKTTELFTVTADVLTLACNDTVELGIFGCEVYLTPDILLEGNPNNAYTIELSDGQIGTSSGLLEEFTGIDWSIILDSDASQIDYQIFDNCGQNCWGSIHFYHSFDIPVTCSDVIVPCFDELVLGQNVPFPLINNDLWSALWSLDNDAYNITFNNNACITLQAHYDDVMSMDCSVYNGQSTSAYIDRTWTFSFDTGEYLSCTQRIYQSRPESTDIMFPSDLTGGNAIEWITMLNADGEVNLELLDANGNFDPSLTGAPTLNGQGLESCSHLEFTYEDVNVASICRGKYKWQRTWTALDWCDGSVIRHVQIIETKDETAPVIKCPDDLTVANEVYLCEKTIALAYPIANDNINTMFVYEMDIAYRNNNPTSPNAYIHLGTYEKVFDDPSVTLSIGSYSIRYIVYDSCGNSSECYYNITVEDQESPLAVCDENTVVTLRSDGCAEILASSFDDGSSDNCGIAEFKVKWSDQEQADYRASLQVCCTGCSTSRLVDFEVTDIHGLKNTCQVLLTIEDKQPLEFTTTPISNILRSCLDPFANIAELRESYISDFTFNNVCNYDITVEIASNELLLPGVCGNNEYVIEWDFFNSCGQELSFTQQLSYENPSIATILSWPENHVIEGCSTIPTPEELNDKPIIEDQGCNQTASTFKDEYFMDTDEACIKILRKWTVINWCIYDPDAAAPIGIYENVQVIRIQDNQAPTIANCPEDFVIEGFTDDCLVVTNDDRLILETSDACTDLLINRSIRLEWTITDEQGVDISGVGNNANGTYSYGSYTIRWAATDHCGNVNTTCAYNFDVIDAKNPTPYCRTDAVLVLDTGGEVALWASDLDLGGSDNYTGNLSCSMEQISIYFKDENNIKSSVLDFSCADLGSASQVTISTQLWYEDEYGNTDFCNVDVQLQDNSGICNDSGLSRLAGDIYLESGDKLNAVNMIKSDGSVKDTSFIQDGEYAFNDLIQNKNYSFDLEKTDDHLNGVSTLDLVLIQKHILGLRSLDSEYTKMAADINHDGNISAIDLIELRKLILGIYEELPSYDTPWRFTTVLDDEGLLFNEMVDHDFIVSLNKPNATLDYMSMKVGDVNGTVVMDSLASVSVESRSNPVALEVEDIMINNTEESLIPFYVEDAMSISGMQFEFELDENIIVKDVIPNQILLHQTDWHLNLNDDNPTLTISWNSNQSLDVSNDDPLFYLLLESKSNLLLSELIGLSDTRIQAEIYTNDYSVKALNLEFGDLIDKQFNVSQNFPNPFINSTEISIEVPSKDELVLEIYNVSGQLIYYDSRIVEKGSHKIQLTSDILLDSKGVIFYKATFNNSVISKKMLRL